VTRNGKNGKNGNGKNGNGVSVFPNHRRRRRQRRRRDRTAARRFVFLAIVATLLATAAALVAAAFAGFTAFRQSCDLSSLKAVSIGQNSFVYAADGSLLGAIPAERNRQPVTLAQLSEWVPNATIAIEDRRFYDHSGLDYEGIVRAAIRNLEEGEIVQGGSTITQQLVRNLYIGRERSLDRKAKEACLALKLEEEHSKDWILQTYLNQVYFGNHAYGIEAAAQTYFSKPAAKLKLVQAALLVGLPQAPSVYDPFERPDEAVRRRNDVLGAMLSAGYIDAIQYEQAVAAPLKLKAGELYTRIREPFFFSFVREQLIAQYGANTVRGGGLRVYTTIVPRFQKLAVKAMRDTLNLRSDPASAIVSINPKNGAIRAMTAVIPGKKNTQFNLAAQGRRQAGSAFKTFVLTEAIRQQINPDRTMYLSAPFRWQPDPSCTAEMDPNCVWEVETYANDYYGPSTITQSTLRSDNTAYARLTLDVGPQKVVNVAKSMGIRTKLEPVASIGLGSNSVSVLEMASAYATLASGGVYVKPMAIRKVVLPDGTVDAGAGWGDVKRKRVFSDGVAYEVVRILKQNIQAGTGTGANPGFPAGGKTGTTDDFGDAWFAGVTTNASTVVWVGYPNAKIPMESVHGIRVAGGTFPATIWGLFMRGAFGAKPPRDWLPPSDPVVWVSFNGQYQYKGAPPSAGGGEAQEEEEEEKEKKKDEEEAPTTTAAPPPPPPETTTATDE
jgi:penicillin-binding protein 1A